MLRAPPVALALICLSCPASAQAPAKISQAVAQMPASTAMVPGTPPPVEGAFSIAVLPDTQYYAQLHPDIFHKQTQWVADNAARQNIKFVLQLGDVTQTAADVEWEVARDSFKILENKVPWASAPGNHDYGGNLQIITHRSAFSVWFPPAIFQAMPTFGGVYDKQREKADNQWHHFDAGGHKWLIMGLEFSPRADVLRWAGEVAAAHPDHSVIVFTHAYLDPRTNQHIKLSAAYGKKKDGQAAPLEKPDVSQGEDIWQKVAFKNPNVVMVICGHAGYANHTTSNDETGHAVQELVVDYQGDVNGGNGWMRLLQFLPDGKTVRTRDFSPWIDQTCTMPDRTFDFELAVPAK